ncbi:DUF6051 family protein [Empedobacter brevis]|uniref:DUF6051 family protein n=1 Tax=Empedobacter brevis TaxID=247 RepID=UPI0023F50CF5|nr:DUF6051 family protein [Empedobacter brevis]
MQYHQLYQQLKEAFDLNQTSTKYPALNLKLIKHQITSDSAEDLLTDSSQLICKDHHLSFDESDLVNMIYGNDDVDIRDHNIECNKKFDYIIVQRLDTEKAEGAIIFFHGLNEKNWDKYLPWAYEIAQQTKKAVILFPIAFHMNRAEDTWSDRRKMVEVSKMRMKDNRDNSDSSYVNAAISARLEAYPQRIFWSGFQTYSDTIKLINQIRNGELYSIKKNAKIDLFGYSIGSFLSVILMMANPKGIFSDSKLFCFCGGMTIDRMYPISKYIMDSKAAITMQTVFAELLSTNFKNDKRLGHFQNPSLHKEESWFKMMLRYNYFQKEREERLKDLQLKIKSYVLEKDEVAPPIEALNTLQGGYRKLKTAVEIVDYAFDYSHMVPFPLTIKKENEITQAFKHFVNSASQFYLK